MTTGNNGRIEMATILLGSIVVVLLAVLASGFAIYGVSAGNARDIANLKETVSSIKSPPPWFEKMVQDNRKDIHDLTQNFVRHTATSDTRMNENEKRIERLTGKMQILTETPAFGGVKKAPVP